MALLDVTEILLDAEFVDTFDVRRRQQIIDDHGRVVSNEVLFSDVVGVVTAISPSDLERKDDYDAMSRSISIVCKFHLRGETTGHQPDIVAWRGNNFLVKHVDPYPQFGAGFFQIECSSMDKTDGAFEVIPTGQYFLNEPHNVVYVGIN